MIHIFKLFKTKECIESLHSAMLKEWKPAMESKLEVKNPFLISNMLESSRLHRKQYTELQKNGMVAFHSLLWQEASSHHLKVCTNMSQFYF